MEMMNVKWPTGERVPEILVPEGALKKLIERSANKEVLPGLIFKTYRLNGRNVCWLERMEESTSSAPAAANPTFRLKEVKRRKGSTSAIANPTSTTDLAAQETIKDEFHKLKDELIFRGSTAANLTPPPIWCSKSRRQLNMNYINSKTN